MNRALIKEILNLCIDPTAETLNRRDFIVAFTGVLGYQPSKDDLIHHQDGMTRDDFVNIINDHYSIDVLGQFIDIMDPLNEKQAFTKQEFIDAFQLGFEHMKGSTLFEALSRGKSRVSRQRLLQVFNQKPRQTL
jgi:hypothetical protein